MSSGRRSQKVAIITGASRGIGAGVATGFRRAGYAVTATSRSIDVSDASDMLAVAGGITRPDTADPVIEQTLGGFGRIRPPVNNAGGYQCQPVTAYTREELPAIPPG